MPTAMEPQSVGEGEDASASLAAASGNDEHADSVMGFSRMSLFGTTPATLGTSVARIPHGSGCGGPCHRKVLLFPAGKGSIEWIR